MENNLKIILFISILFLSIACKSSKDQVLENNEPEYKMVQNTPELLLINFFIDSRDSIKVINTMKNPGRIRGESNLKAEPKEGDLIISFLNEANIVCSKTIVENPMVRKVEYSDTDDLSTLSAKTVDLDSADFFIRVQYDNCFKHLRVEKYSNNQNLELKFLSNFKFPK